MALLTLLGVSALIVAIVPIFDVKLERFVHAELVDGLGVSFGLPKEELDLEFARMHFAVRWFQFQIRLNDVALHLHGGLGDVRVSSVTLSFPWFDPFSLASVVADGLDLDLPDNGGAVHSQAIGLLGDALYKIRDQVGFTAIVENACISDPDFCLSKIVLVGDASDRVVRIIQGNSFLDLNVDSMRKVRVKIYGWPITLAGDIDGSIKFDANFTVSPLPGSYGYSFLVDDMQWESFKGGSAQLLFDEDKVVLSDIVFPQSGVKGSAFYHYKQSAGELDLRLYDSSFSHLISLWPNDISPKLESWLRDNIFQGHVGYFQFNLFYSDGKFSVGMQSDFHDLAMNVKTDYGESILTLDGHLDVNDTDVQVHVARGTFAEVAITEGQVIIGHNLTGDLVTRFTGKAAASIQEAGPLLGMSFPEDRVTGAVYSDFDLMFINESKGEQKFDGEIRGLRIPKLDFQSDAMAVRSINGKISAGGFGNVKGTKIFVNLIDYSEQTLRFSCQGNFRVLPKHTQLSGIVLGDLKASFQLVYNLADSRISADVKIDLREANFALDYFDWSNSSDGGGYLSAKIHQEGDNTVLDSFILAAKGLEVIGSGRITNEVLDLNLSQVMVGSDFFSASYMKFLKPPEGKVESIIKINAKSMRLNLSFQSALDGSTLVSGHVDNLVAKNGVVLHDVFFRADPIVPNSFVNAKLPGNKHLIVVQNERGLDVQSKDAGLLLAALDITTSVKGGELFLHVEPPLGTDNSADGELVIDTFSLIDAPLLAQILSVASLQGIANTLSGQGIAFHKLNSNFTYGAGNIAFKESWLEGTALGISFQGDFNLESKQYDFKGELVPFYVINKIFSNIPVFGQLLSGGAGKGVFSVDYSIKSRTGVKDVSINILSVFAPKLFKLFAKTASE